MADIKNEQIADNKDALANAENSGKKSVSKSKKTDKKDSQSDKSEQKSVKKKEKSQKNGDKKTEDSKKQKKTASKTKKKSVSINIKYLGGLLLSKMARAGANQLSSNADEVNKLNVFPVPDGDTGDNMKMTIDSGIAALENTNTDNLSGVMSALSHGMLLGARGNSGVILSQFFAGVSKGLENSTKADPTILGHAFEEGVKQAYSSVMTPTEGTILTVAREAVEYAVSRITPKSTIRTFFSDLVKEMHASLDRTPETLKVLKEAGVVDSGGAGLLYIMEGFNRVLNGEEVADVSIREKVANANQTHSAVNTSFGPDSEMTYGYCTELLLQLQTSKTDIDNFDIEALKAFLASLGDSIVAFKTDSIVKLHVHTFTPEKVLAHCRTFGEFLTVKIENMSVQHSDTLNKDKKEESEKKSEEIKEKKKYGVVAVSTGAGIENLFLELGADIVIKGGQTHNPSTSEFIEAFEKIPAENIFVFPNNGNILMASQQAGELYPDANVFVIPSKNIGMGYVALSFMDFSKENPEELLSDANEAMSRVTSGYVSPSIRDANMNGVHIHTGDTIGIIDKEIVISETDRAAAASALASKLLDIPGKFMLTIFRGIDASPEEASTLEADIKSAHPDAEVYFIDGGQDIYPYIFVAE